WTRTPARRLARRSLGEGGPTATRVRLDLRGTADVSHRNQRPTHLHRFRRNTYATAAERERGSRDLGHGSARFEGTIGCRAGTFAAALRSAESPGQFLSAVERWISVWAAHGFPAGATRLRASESQPLNPTRLFSAMDTAEAVNPNFDRSGRRNRIHAHASGDVER